ncbi:MAG: response regulator [Alphaproteobacteria bacterium]|nr:response regulator [Alphaproteobacteria bacterium]
MLIRALYHNIPVGVCVLKRDRKDMHILYTNKTLNGMIGYDADADLTGKILEDIWPDAKSAHALEQQLKGMVPPEDATLSFEHPALGERHWVKIDIKREIWNETGEGVDSFILWATDITASKETEEHLKSEIERADALADMKSNFLATMSHEIRTPMQTIYGLLELIGDEDKIEKIHTMVGIAQNAASGLLEILDDILDLAKVDAGKMELDVFEVPVRLLVRGLLEALSVKVHGKAVKLVDDIEQDVPFVVIGDPKRLRQIIMNLCGNAIKFTDQGAVTVHVTTQTKYIAQPDKGVALRFEIIDTGMGMPPEVCDRLFGSFVQADNTTARRFGGTGLGLSISKKLVELMGGKIGVESVVGQGSTFWFEIPTEEVGTEVSTIQLPDLEGISVLSVEDHPQGAKEIMNSLKSMGASVEQCSTCAEARDLASKRPFDVAVVDQGLPDGLGLDLLKDVMKIRPNMGLVMYTVRDDVGLAHSLQTLGATFLTKPASRAGLGEAVKNAASKVASLSIDGPRRLLIAEDTQSIRDVLQRQLEKVGVEADFAVNGREALDMLQSGKYGILITDLHMPEIDGYQVVGTIRDEEKGGDKRFPVIVLTADVQMAQRETYMSHGFDECLLKPVSLGQLSRLLVRWGLIGEKEENTALPELETIKTPPETDVPPTPVASNLPPAVDKEAMIAQMGAFDEMAVEMLEMFVEMTAPIIDDLKKAKAAKDFHDLQELAHSLKGGARSACCNVLGEIASKLQQRSEADEFAPRTG